MERVVIQSWIDGEYRWNDRTNDFPERWEPSRFTVNGPTLSPEQFFHSISTFAIQPELVNGRLERTKLVTADSCRDIAPTFMTAAGLLTDVELEGIPTSFGDLLSQPFGRELFDAVESLGIQRIELFRNVVGISGCIFTVKECWDFQNLSVILEYDETLEPRNICPPTLLHAYVIGPDTDYPICAIDLSFKFETTDCKLVEEYRTNILPRVLKWSSGGEYRAETVDKSPRGDVQKLVELAPTCSPQFFDCSGTVESRYGFLRALSIFASKPHVVNKRVKGAELNSGLSGRLPKFFTFVKADERFIERRSADFPPDLYEALNEPLTKSVITDFLDFGVDRIVLWRRVIGKSLKEYAVREDWDLRISRVLIEYDDGGVACTEASTEFPPLVFDGYMVGNHHARIMIGVSGKNPISNCDSLIKSLEYFHRTALPRILKWAEHDDATCRAVGFIPTSSLKYVGLQAYFEEYDTMKTRLFEPLQRIWSETTDPLKFIPEEVGIAAYVYTFVESVSDGERWNFVDIGCGNGVLTFVLADAGIRGYGFDIRPRKLWEQYKLLNWHCEPNLNIQSYNPFVDKIKWSSNQWLIGNHCDELTPWIAVMARQSDAAGFIVIPCCFYDFHGKFQRKSSKVEAVNKASRYENYIYYISEIGKKCGYEISIDKLRIPSTKRVCIIGRDIAKDSVLRDAREYARCKIVEFPTSDTSIGGLLFKPRSPVERVNNGTQLAKDLLEKVIIAIFNTLIANSNFVIFPGYLLNWNCGFPQRLDVVVQHLSKEDRKSIKSQGKGLQTLLKNSHQVFIIEKGCVRLRCPIVDDRMGKESIKTKTRRCFFYQHHPQGCPIASEVCRFEH